MPCQYVVRAVKGRRRWHGPGREGGIHTNLHTMTPDAAEATTLRASFESSSSSISTIMAENQTVGKQRNPYAHGISWKSSVLTTGRHLPSRAVIDFQEPSRST